MNFAKLNALEHHVMEIQTAARIIQQMHNTAGILEVAAWIEEQAEKAHKYAKEAAEKAFEIAYEKAIP